jgi:hypothetical protein
LPAAAGDIPTEIAVSRAHVQTLIDAALSEQAAVHAERMRVYDAALDELRAAVVAMKAHGASPNVFEPLKRAAAIAQVDYENARRWCAGGLVIAKKIKSRWFVDQESLAAYAALTR